MFLRLIVIALSAAVVALSGCGVECGDGTVEEDGRCVAPSADAGETDVPERDTASSDTAETDTSGTDISETDTMGTDVPAVDASPEDVLGEDITPVDAGPDCGNGMMDDGEQCDDGNDTPDDGCEADCMFSCETATDCDNGNACDGAEVCNTTLHVCEEGTPLDCNDADPCTADSCVRATGCVNTFIDGDMDGYSPNACTTPGLLGGDCNDRRAVVNPAQGGYFATPIDGSFDYNCDGDDTPRWPRAGRCADFSCRGPLWRCSGSGCTAVVPACGDAAPLGDCLDIGGRCAPMPGPPTVVQECQ